MRELNFLCVALVLLLTTIYAGDKVAQREQDKPASPEVIENSKSQVPDIGEAAPDFRLSNLEGKSVSLSSFKNKRIVVLEFGSYTCPPFWRKIHLLNQLYEKYQDRNDVVFLIIYAREQNPDEPWATIERKPCAQPKTMAERVKLARQLKEKAKINIPIFIDTMDNRVFQAYGAAPNAAFIVDKQGRIALYQQWTNVGALDTKLSQLLGIKVVRAEYPTRPSPPPPEQILLPKHRASLTSPTLRGELAPSVEGRNQANKSVVKPRMKTPTWVDSFFKSYDKNKDGKISTDEYHSEIPRFKDIDKNDDGFIVREELEQAVKERDARQGLR